MASPVVQPSTPLLLLSTQTVTSAGNSPAFQLPQGEAYALYLVAATATGTTNAILQTALDNGTTWVNTGMAFASITGPASQGLLFKPTMGVGQNAAPIAPIAGTASATNQPVNQKFMRLAFTGTTPAMTYSLYAVTSPKGYSVV